VTALQRFWEANRWTILLIGGLVAAYAFLRTSPSNVGSTDDVMALIGSRDASVLYFL